MKFRGRAYNIVFEGNTYKYNRRGEYGGVGEAYKGITRIESIRGKHLATFRLSGEATGRSFSPDKLFTYALGIQHYDNFVTPLDIKSFIDIVASELLILYSLEIRAETEVLVSVNWRGISNTRAVFLGLVPDSSGQLMMEVKS